MGQANRVLAKAMLHGSAYSCPCNKIVVQTANHIVGGNQLHGLEPDSTCDHPDINPHRCSRARTVSRLPATTVVPEGYFVKAPGQVAPCARGAYKAGFAAVIDCSPCAGGVTTPQEGSKSEAACSGGQVVEFCVSPCCYPITPGAAAAWANLKELISLAYSMLVVLMEGLNSTGHVLVMLQIFGPPHGNTHMSRLADARVLLLLLLAMPPVCPATTPAGMVHMRSGCTWTLPRQCEWEHSDSHREMPPEILLCWWYCHRSLRCHRQPTPALCCKHCCCLP